jgi:hypothetical protein
MKIEQNPCCPFQILINKINSPSKDFFFNQTNLIVSMKKKTMTDDIYIHYY